MEVVGHGGEQAAEEESWKGVWRGGVGWLMWEEEERGVKSPPVST